MSARGVAALERFGERPPVAYVHTFAVANLPTNEFLSCEPYDTRLVRVVYRQSLAMVVEE
jgi:hypothetical protein